MANLKVLDGDAAAKYLSTGGAGTDADPHVSHHVLDENTDGVYIGDIKFGESLLAGTNAIGKLAANSGVDIGDVTINNASGAAAVNIQDGGNTITVDGAVAATQSGTWDVGTIATVTNPIAIKNAAADTVTGVSGTYDTIDVSLTNGTYRATIDSSGYLTTNINGTITVDGSVTADTELPAAGTLGDAMDNPTTPLLGACLMGWDSVAGKWERCKTDASNYLKVDASVATVTVTGDAAGSLTVDQATHDSLNCNANLQQGDTDVASNNELYVRGSGTAGSPDAAVLTVQGVGSMTPVIVTGDSAGSLTVDQGTAANLKATVYGAGSAGSADAGVVTIQGISSMTPILATLQASDGTDIGNVDVASVVPGTGASNLGKAEDAAHTSGDVGVMVLGVRKDDTGSLASADGDYTPLLINEHGILRTQAQQHFHIDEMNATAGWSVLGTDTVNLATTTNHVFNTLALEFDKVDGAANTVFAGIQKTLASTDLAPYGKGGGFFLWSIYLSSLTDVAYVFLRLGTDSSNYNEWRIDDDELAIGWNPLRMGIFGPAAVVANGWDTTGVTYVALGVAFDDEADELADIAADHLSVNTGLQTSADIVAEVSSSVRTPNVNILKVGNKSIDIGTGNAGVGTMRVVLASDQPVLSIDDNASSLSIDIGGQAPQLDDTDKIAVSLYGKGANAGDDAVETDGSGNLQVVGTGTAGSAAGGILTVQGVGSMTPVIVTGDDAGSLTVDGSVTADTEFAAAAALSDTFGNPTTATVGSMLMGWDSTNSHWERWKAIEGLSNTNAGNGVTLKNHNNDETGLMPVVVLGYDDTTNDNAYRALATNASGQIEIADGGNTITVDGTVTAAQATHDNLKCNANIQQGDADVTSSNELYVRGSGTAGSADAAVLTVQGVASMTPILATLQASDGTDIGNVDIASASFEKAEDAGHSTGDKGVMALAVRHDTISSLCGTDLDYTPLQVDATGYLYTKDKNAASLAVVGGGAESTALRVTIANDSTGVLTVDDGGGTLTVDGTVTATPSGIQEIEGDEAESSGNLPQPVLIGGDDGTDVKNINVDATTGDVQVDVTNQVDVGGATPVVTPVTGNASPFSTSYAPSADFWLESITLHLSAAGTTSELFTVTLNATDGGAYDTLLFSQDLSKGAVTDLVWVPEGGPMLFENSDAIDIAWNNEEDRTYGLRLVTRLA